MTTDSKAVNLLHSDVVPEAVKEVLMMACGTVAEVKDQVDSNAAEDGLIVAVISVMGDVDWSIFLGLPRDTAETMANGFAGFEIPFDSEDMGDAIGEVTNILAGSVKQILDKRGVNVEISLPSVMRVDGLHVLVQSGSPTAKTGFACSLGEFWTGLVAGKNAGLVA